MARRIKARARKESTAPDIAVERVRTARPASRRWARARSSSRSTPRSSAPSASAPSATSSRSGVD